MIYSMQKTRLPLKKNHRFELENFLRSISELNKSPHTLRNYRMDLEGFLHWYEAQEHSSIEKTRAKHIGHYRGLIAKGGDILSPLTLKHFVLERLFFRSTRRKVIYRREPLKIGSQRRHLSAIKSFFEYLKEVHEDSSGRFKVNPVKGRLHRIKVKDIDIEHTPLLESEDFRRLNESTTNSKDRLMIFLLYYGGLRLDELRQLKYSDFDKSSQTIQLIRKGGKIHLLKIWEGQKIFNQLHFHQKDLFSNSSQYVFAGHAGAMSHRGLHGKIKRLLKKAYLSEKIGPHSFRKACATELYLLTKDLLFVRDYLHHSDAKVTQTYIDIRSLEKEKSALPKSE